jgi:hypothetical protein
VKGPKKKSEITTNDAVEVHVRFGSDPTKHVKKRRARVLKIGAKGAQVRFEDDQEVRWLMMHELKLPAEERATPDAPARVIAIARPERLVQEEEPVKIEPANEPEELPEATADGFDEDYAALQEMARALANKADIAVHEARREIEVLEAELAAARGRLVTAERRRERLTRMRELESES